MRGCFLDRPLGWACCTGLNDVGLSLWRRTRTRRGRISVAMLSYWWRHVRTLKRSAPSTRNMYGPSLRISGRVPRDREIASDLTAETFAAALAGIDRFDPTKGTPMQWLYGIANNLLKRMWRTNRVSDAARQKLQIQTPLTATSGWDELEAVDAHVDSDRLTSALERVPPKSRRAVQLRILDRMAYNEIARQIGCKPGAARALVFRGLKRLKHEFESPPGCRKSQ